MSIYDLVIDTSVYQPTEVVRQIETRLKGDKR
jgi:cytidylate kinase